MKPQIRVMRQPYRCKGLAVFVDQYPESPSDMAMTAEPIVFREIENVFEQDVNPAVTIDENAAQQLMDDLWQCGLRPSEGTGSAGAFAAQGKHLEDMRRLVFDSECGCSTQNKFKISKEK